MQATENITARATNPPQDPRHLHKFVGDGLASWIDDFNRFLDERLLNALLFNTLLVVCGSVGAFVAYGRNDGYWTFMFGENGPYGETAMLFIGTFVVFWQRNILFPRNRQGGAETRNPRAFRIALVGFLLFFV